MALLLQAIFNRCQQPVWYHSSVVADDQRLQILHLIGSPLAPCQRAGITVHTVSTELKQVIRRI